MFGLNGKAVALAAEVLRAVARQFGGYRVSSGTMMYRPIRESRTCVHCGKIHQTHQHLVSVFNRGTLLCSTCGHELLSWAGLIFYTLPAGSECCTPSSERQTLEVVAK
jgi:hypothetical protein